jgi:hypothetical protein
VFAEVRDAGGGKQSPFLNTPGTSPPLIIHKEPQR